MKNDRSELQRALQHAVEQRTCPTDEILASGGAEAELHLKSCRACREWLGNRPVDLPAIKSGMSNLTQLYTLPPHKEAAPGQVWSVNRTVGGWGARRQYINPPLVLILKELPQRELLVSQICSDDLLMGVDDLWLGDGIGFAEPWNLYPLSKRDLDHLLAEVDEALTVATASDDHPYPGIEHGSPLWHFRQIEKEVGETISLRSSEQRGFQLVESFLSEFGKIRANLLNRVKGWRWPEDASDTLRFLLGARPELLPLRASEGGDHLDATIIRISRPDEPELTRSSCLITRWNVDVDGLLVCGRLPDDICRPLALHAAWGGPPPRPADEALFDRETGAFKIRVHGIIENVATLEPLQVVIMTHG